jgi:hypothetical protein
MNASTTTATTTNAVVTETAPEAVKVKRTWKEFRQLVWAYCTFPARKSWETMCTLTDFAVRAAMVATCVVLIGCCIMSTVAYGSFLGRIEANTAATQSKLIEVNTPKSFGQWLYGVTVVPATNADGYVRGAVGLGE